MRCFIELVLMVMAIIRASAVPTPVYATAQPSPLMEELPPAALVEPVEQIIVADAYSIIPIAENMTAEEATAVLILAGTPEEWVDPLLRIGECESHLKPASVGDGGDSLGWLQLNRYHFAKAGYDVEQYADPVVSARVALWLRSARGRFGGPGGWACADILGIP